MNIMKKIDLFILLIRTYSENENVAQNRANQMITSVNFLLLFESWLPVIDNNIVNGTLISLIRNVSFQLKPLIVSSLTDECYYMIYGALNTNVAFAISLFGEKPMKVLEHYPPIGSSDQRQNGYLPVQIVFSLEKQHHILIYLAIHMTK